MEDFYYKNQYYAKIGGITKLEIDQLEVELLDKLDFRVYVSQAEFNTYLNKLAVYIEVNQ